MMSLSGNATTAEGVPVDHIRIFIWPEGELVDVIEPDANGDWDFLPAFSQSYGITYIASGCRPVTHGPYFVEVAGGAFGENIREVVLVDGAFYALLKFTQNGSLTISGGVEAEILVVGGGGAGGTFGGGGGGGGGVAYAQKTLYSGIYPITVGAGGENTSSRADGSPGGETSIYGPGGGAELLKATGGQGGYHGRGGAAGGASGAGYVDGNLVNPSQDGALSGSMASGAGAGAGEAGVGMNGGAGLGFPEVGAYRYGGGGAGQNEISNSGSGGPDSGGTNSAPAPENSGGGGAGRWGGTTDSVPGADGVVLVRIPIY